MPDEADHPDGADVDQATDDADRSSDVGDKAPGPEATGEVTQPVAGTDLAEPSPLPEADRPSARTESDTAPPVESGQEGAEDAAVPLVTGLIWLAVALVAGLFVVIMLRPVLARKRASADETASSGDSAPAVGAMRPKASVPEQSADTMATPVDDADYAGAVPLDEDFLDLDHTELTPPSKAPPDATTQSDRLKANLVDIGGVCAVRVFSLSPSKPTVVTRAQRAETADTRYLVIKQSGVSREHAVIEYREGGFHVVDTGSTNGSRVNGRKVTEPVLLSNGDHLHFDTHEFLFEQSLGDGA